MEYLHKNRARLIVSKIFFYVFLLFAMFILASFSAEEGLPGATLALLIFAYIIYWRIKEKIVRPHRYIIRFIATEELLGILDTSQSINKGEVLALDGRGDFSIEKVARLAYPRFLYPPEGKIKEFVDIDFKSIAVVYVKEIPRK